MCCTGIKFVANDAGRGIFKWFICFEYNRKEDSFIPPPAEADPSLKEKGREICPIIYFEFQIRKNYEIFSSWWGWVTEIRGGGGS